MNISKQPNEFKEKNCKGKPEFAFVDLFAGIEEIRRGFESIGGQCVFTSELEGKHL